jgi:hypothetical protein
MFAVKSLPSFNIKTTFQGFSEVQGFLSKAQSIPIVGVIPSAVKLGVSIVEIVAGLATCIIFGIIALMFNQPIEAMALNLGLSHAMKGIHSFQYGLANIVTLGFLAFKDGTFYDREDMFEQPVQLNRILSVLFE